MKLQRINTSSPLLRLNQLPAKQVFYISVTSTPSTTKSVIAGALQVVYSILSLLLFIHSKFPLNCLYRRHRHLHRHHKNATKYIQTYFDQLQDYFTNWKLQINLVKTKVIAFRNKKSKSSFHRRTQYSFGSPRSSTFGVLLDAKVTWVRRPPKEQISLFAHSEDYIRYSATQKQHLKTNIKLIVH